MANAEQIVTFLEEAEKLEVSKAEAEKFEKLISIAQDIGIGPGSMTPADDQLAAICAFLKRVQK